MKKILNVIFVLAIVILIESIGIESLIVKTLSEEFTSKQVSEQVLNAVTKKYDVGKLGEIEDKVRESPYIEEITSEFLNTITNNLVNNKKEKLDIESKVKNIVNEELKDLPENQKQEIQKQLNKVDFAKIEETLEEELPNNFSPKVMQVFNIYNIIIQPWFRILMGVIAVISIILIIVLNEDKSKALRKIGISLLVETAIIAIQMIVLKNLSLQITNEMLGRSVELNTDVFMTLTASGAAVAAVILLISQIISMKTKRATV